MHLTDTRELCNIGSVHGSQRRELIDASMLVLLLIYVLSIILLDLSSDHPIFCHTI